MKRILFILAFISTCLFVNAQQGQAIVKKGEKGLYVEHKISSKENFYSIGRMYHVHPKELASYNQLDMAGGLSLGQVIRIPLTSGNFSQELNTNGTPVYYKVGEKEGLYRVSSNNNQVAMANLRKWNNLSNDNIIPGTRLIVGYIKPVDMVTTAVNTEVKSDTNAEKTPSKQEPTVAVLKEETKIGTKEVKTNEPEVKDNKITTENNSPQEFGFFKSFFDQQIKTYPVSKDQTVTSGIFKTSSGWQDGKYYALMDKVEPGTIIRIINPSNNKTVYAKVLGEMSGIRQNARLNIRISNAAAASLGIQESDKFIVKVNY